jgi:hypothetical protein
MTVDGHLVDQIAVLQAAMIRDAKELRDIDAQQAAADREAEAVLTLADEMITLGSEMGGEEGDQLINEGVDELVDMTETGRLIDQKFEQQRLAAGQRLTDAIEVLIFLCGTPMTPGTANQAHCPQTLRCPGFDFANGSRSWFATQPSPSGKPRPESSYDRVNECLCQALGGRVPGTCGDATERQKQDCLANPLGPDDGPRSECVRLMRPAQIDRKAIEARLCTLFRPNCDVGRKALITETGSCGCATGTGQPGSVLTPHCAAVVDCADGSMLDARTCLCQPLNAGGTPFIEPKGCSVNVAGAPGGLDQWLLSSTTAVSLDRKPLQIGGVTQVKDSLSFAPGSVAAAMPVFRTEEWLTKGTSVVADVAIPQAMPASGKRGFAQAHLTIGKTFSDFVGKTDLTTLSPGVQRLTFPLPSTARSLLQQAGKDVRLTFVLQTEATAPARTNLVSFGFDGAPLPTPGPSPTCPTNPLTPSLITFTPRGPTDIAAWPFVTP